MFTRETAGAGDTHRHLDETAREAGDPAVRPDLAVLLLRMVATSSSMRSG